MLDWLQKRPEIAMIWGVSLLGGTIAGVVMLWDSYGAGSLFAGFIGGCGTAIILSANRLIADGDE